MRMWMVPPGYMCRKHLLGEHLETHMFVGCIIEGTKLDGYIDKGLLEVDSLHRRHSILAMEMKRRGYKHNSPLKEFSYLNRNIRRASINRNLSLKELISRCPECRERYSRG